MSPRHLQREIDRLKQLILSLCAEVEANVKKAVAHLGQQDETLAREMKAADEKIDQREVEVEEECLKILALHQPVAIDLRFIIAVLKINSDLERVGDQALNIVLQGRFVEAAARDDLKHLERMADKARAMLEKSLDALVNLDLPTAEMVLSLDDEVDRYNREMYDRVKARLAEDTQRQQSLIHLLMISHNLERIADLATNIAEDVIYMVEGRIVRHGGSALRENNR